jgi:sulfatase maturation enzyme AslB (radical SAM superfamily)
MIFKIKPDHNLSLEGLKTHTCMVPYYQFQIYDDGSVEACCSTWMSKKLGNFYTDTAKKILESPILQHIKNDMSEGKWSYCTDACPHLIQFLKSSTTNVKQNGWGPIVEKDKLQELVKNMKYEIYFNFDRSCNLQCPSCRLGIEHVSSTKDPEKYSKLEILQKQTEDLVELLLEKNDLSGVAVNITGSGDPFASELYWKYLLKLNELVLQPKYKKLTIRLQTNGLLLTPDRFTKIKNLWKHIDWIAVSVDATTQETYSIVRKGGKLTNVLSNLMWLDELVSNNEVGISAEMTVDNKFQKLFWIVNFVVQAENYKEMADFARYHLQHKTIKHIWYNLIADWGHLNALGVHVFSSKAIWMSNHPEHQNFLNILKDPVFKNPKVDIGSMSAFI